MNDGGQWDMLVNLIKKYGVVPKYTMPESFQQQRIRRGMNTHPVAEKAAQGRRGAAPHDRAGKDRRRCRARRKGKAMVAEIYGMLCCFLGEPPEAFNFEYRDQG